MKRRVAWESHVLKPVSHQDGGLGQLALNPVVVASGSVVGRWWNLRKKVVPVAVISIKQQFVIRSHAGKTVSWLNGIRGPLVMPSVVLVGNYAHA